ncbi:MAG: hypothetical protein IPK80_00355 [Nannocystis sp.]|nr:hypothetical protein [Nannocystis sp.]
MTTLDSGRIGQLGQLLDDLDQHGSDTAPPPLRRRLRPHGSAPAPARRPPTIPPTSTSAASPSYPPTRPAAAPSQECDRAYCPGALLSGAECRFDAECESGECQGRRRVRRPQDSVNKASPS